MGSQRRLSITAARAKAQCLLARTGHLGQAAREAAARRKVVREQVERGKEDRAIHYEAHVLGRRLRHAGRLHLH